MELAKNLSQWRDQSPEQWVALANRTLPPVVVALLVVLIAVQAAGLTWRLLESPADQDSVPPAAPASANAGSGALTASLDVLRSWRPFGEPPAPDAGISRGDIDDTEETDLALTLLGAVQKLDLPEPGETVVPDKGTAIIRSGRAEQETYAIGETIADARGATLHSVFRDFVLIDRGGGRLERLSFPEADEAIGGLLNSRVTARQAEQPAPPSAQDPQTAMASFTESIGAVAGTLGQVMRIDPHMENGRTIGYRLQPSGPAGTQAFSQLGLEPGDVLREVNGIPLDDVRNIQQVFQALSENPQASVTIRRNDADQAMVIDMNQLERLVESLQ